MSTEERINDIIAEQIGVDKASIKRESRFIEDLGADSLDIVELMMNIEETFSVDIPDDEAEKILTVGDALAYIENKL
ncbi:MAG: acyl carrier protein [Proteobacteria bacterium]|nr:acyl carrier protein [Pseudomonadota bacterium]